MDFMELSRDTTRFRKEFQYLPGSSMVGPWVIPKCGHVLQVLCSHPLLWPSKPCVHAVCLHVCICVCVAKLLSRVTGNCSAEAQGATDKAGKQVALD